MGLEVISTYPGPWLAWMIPMAGALLMPLLAKAGDRVRDLAAVLFAFAAVLSTFSMMPWLISGEYPGDIKLMTWIAFPDKATLEEGVLVVPWCLIIAHVVSL